MPGSIALFILEAGASSKLLLLIVILAVCAFTSKVIEDGLTHTHRLGSNLYIFVFLDVFQSLFKAEDDRRNDTSLFVGTGSADIGQLLCLGDVDDEVVVVNVLTNYLTSVNLILRIDEELTAVLQVVNGISEGGTTFKSNHRTVETA